MAQYPIYASPVAITVPFDNSTNGFAAIEVQSGIEEAKNSSNTSYLSATATVSTTSGTFGTIADMTITPTVGTWVGHFTCAFRSTGTNTDGDIAIFVGGVELSETQRPQTDTAAILGLVTLSSNSGGCSGAIVFRRAFTGSEQITVRFRENGGGTMFIDGRTFFLQQVGL